MTVQEKGPPTPHDVKTDKSLPPQEKIPYFYLLRYNLRTKRVPASNNLQAHAGQKKDDIGSDVPIGIDACKEQAQV